MSTLTAVGQELIGLFVDDSWFAIAILGVVLCDAVLMMVAPGHPLFAGVLLLLGCLGVLATNVTRNARR